MSRVLVVFAGIASIFGFPLAIVFAFTLGPAYLPLGLVVSLVGLIVGLFTKENTLEDGDEEDYPGFTKEKSE